MIHAYDKIARTALRRMLDFAAYDLKYDITEFLICLSAPGLSDNFRSMLLRY